MTPTVETLQEFFAMCRDCTSANGPALLLMWKDAEERAAHPVADPHEHLTPKQRAKVDEAYRWWQAEESRDRGFDYATCRRLEREYRRLLASYTEEEAA